MAKSATISLDLDVAEFRKSLAAARTETEKFGGTLEDAIADSTKAVESLGKGFDKVSSDSTKSIGDIKKAIAAMIVAGENTGDAFDGLIAELKRAEAEAGKLKDALKQVDALTVEPEIKIDTEGAKTGLAGIGDSIKSAFSQAKEGDLSGLGNLGSIAAGAVPGLSLATEAIGAVGAAIGETIEKGKNFDKALKSVAIQTGLSADQLKGLGNAAQGAFVQGVGESADEAVKILGSLRQTLGEKIPLDQLQNAAVRTNQVASSLGVETPELVAKLSPLIKQYGISFDQALNLVSSGAQKGVGDIGGYLDAIQEFTPNLKEAGFSAEQFQGLLAKAGEQGVKDFAKVGDGVKELQNRIKSGDLTTQLEGIGGATSKELQKIAKLGQTGAISGAEVLKQSVGEIDKAFASGQISDALRGQLLTTLGGSIAEDLGSEVYSKIFGAPIDTAAIKKNAAEAGKVIDESIPPPDLGRIFDIIQTNVGRAFNFIYQTLIGPLVGPFLDAFKQIGDLFGQVFGGEAGKANAILSTLKTVLTAVANVVAGQLVNGFRILTTLFNIVTAPVRALVNFIGFLIQKFLDATGASGKLSSVFTFLGDAANYLQTYLGTLFEAVNTLVNGLANLNPSEIAKGWDQLNNVAANTSKKIADDAKKAADATKQQTEATKELKKEAKKTETPIDPEKAKAAAEALRAAKAALAGLNTEQQKAREIRAAESLADEADRQRALLEIDTRYQEQAIEAERKALTSIGELRFVQEQTINKKLEILREETAGKLRDIEAKVQADRVKAADEAEKKITEITTKLAEERVARLQSILEAGGVGVADELLKAQRAIVDNQLSETIDAIAESTPGFKRYAAKIANDLANGLIDADEARRQTASLRQGIIDELLALPADAGNVYAVQLQDAYDKAAKEIATGTQSVTDAIKKAIGKSGTEQYIKSLYGIRDAIAGADFSTPFKESAEATQASTDALNELIESVKAGEETYQSATLKYAELDKERGESATATAAVITEALKAAAQSQLDAANASIDRITELRNRNQEIADELVAIEERKNAALAALRAEDFANQQLFETAKAEINQKAANDEQKLKAEQTANTDAAAQSQEAALRQIGTAAGVAFAGLVTGSKEAGEALKSIVGETVSALLKLYTPSIIAGFQSIVPGPIGFVLGTAAVATLQALLSSALAGFSEGGYTGNVGTSQVAGVVHGREFVINAGATQKNRALLEHINKGGSVDTFGAAPVTELQMMRAELQAIRQRLDSMPNGINGRQVVALDVGFDTYLFERDRRKIAVRGIRG